MLSFPSVTAPAARSRLTAVASCSEKKYAAVLVPVLNVFVPPSSPFHVTTATVERLPIATREMAPAAYREIAALARLLSRKYEASSWATLNARVAGLYHLSPSEFEHVLSTFPLTGVEERQRAFKIFATTVR